MLRKSSFAIRDCAVRILSSPNSAEKDNFNQKELGILFPPDVCDGARAKGGVALSGKVPSQ